MGVRVIERGDGSEARRKARVVLEQLRQDIRGNMGANKTTQKAMAESIGVHPTNIYRGLNKPAPTFTAIIELCFAAGFDVEINLTKRRKRK